MIKILDQQELHAIQSYWDAANFLSVGQIYLKENPLLQKPLEKEHIKQRLLGHFGTVPGLNLVYVHLNRLIRKYEVSVQLIVGPGHGGPAVSSNTYLEGTFSEAYPQIPRNAEGIKMLFRMFSTPGGIPSHVSPHIPGSIHEGGELGYALLHACGAAFDNPDLLVACVIGDGEAETGPLEGSWKSNKFLNPVRDGAVLPILHLNGYKITSPSVLGRLPRQERLSCFKGHGYDVRVVSGDDPMKVHQELAVTLEQAYLDIKAIQQEARVSGADQAERPLWPMIILETPKGWTGPKRVDGKKVEGHFRSHQVPLNQVRENPDHLKILESWMRSYHPEKCFTQSGKLVPELAALIPKDNLRMGANPHANGGTLLKPLNLPDFKNYALELSEPGTRKAEATRAVGKFLRDVFVQNRKQADFRIFCPDELESNRLDHVLEETDRCLVAPGKESDEHLSPDGRVMEVLSEHCCQGWLEGYLLTGRHGLFTTYEAFATIVDSMCIQHTKWLKMSNEIEWRKPVASLNYLLTSHAWRQDHNGFSHQGPGFIDTLMSKKGEITRIYLPPDANCLLSVMDHCLRSRNYVNLVIAGKQPQWQWLDMDSATAHCAQGASVWDWAGHHSDNPDVVLACAGDAPTLETLAAAKLLRQFVPALGVRVVNVVDLMAMMHPTEHPHGMDNAGFEALFTDDKPVIFAFHGYPMIIHMLMHRRPNADRFHVRGYQEEGTTTTPFDMVVLNQMSRFHLAIEALKRSMDFKSQSTDVIRQFEKKLEEHHAYIQIHLKDMPEISQWQWRD